MTPLTIAGGGLAGLALGIALRRRGIPVAVREASTFPRHRVCGEFISGVSEETLQVLGIEDQLADAESLVSTAWYDQRSCIFNAALPEAARGVSRFRLDHRLAEYFQDLGGEFVEGSRLSAEELAGDGVVRATGRPVEKNSDWLGLKAHWLEFPLEADLEMHLGDDGYIGLSRVEEGRVNVAGLFRRRSGVRAKGTGSLIAYTEACGLTALAGRLTEATIDPDSCVGVSSFGFGLKKAQAGGGMRIGDQRAIIPPFTGNGMSMALQSAELALPSLVNFASGELSWVESCAQYERESERFFAARVRAARMVHPFIFSRFGQKVAARMAKAHLLPFTFLYRAVR